jgi:hypothetical protein
MITTIRYDLAERLTGTGTLFDGDDQSPVHQLFNDMHVRSKNLISGLLCKDINERIGINA